MSGDRALGLGAARREKVARRLGERKAPEAGVRSVREVVELGGGEEQKVFGESLPAELEVLG